MKRRITVDRSKKEDEDGRYHMQLIAPVDDLQVAPWSPGDVEKGDACTQVHILFTPPMENLIAAFLSKRGLPMVAIRLKSRAAVDGLISALVEHRDRVWPEDKESV